MFFTPTARHAHLAPVFRAIDPRFQRFLGTAFAAASCASPAPSIQRDEKSWTLSLDMPGIGREHLRVDIEGAVVRVETLADAPRSYRAAWEFAQDIDASASEAKLDNGVLVLKLAKKAPESNATRLSIQ